MTAVPSFINPVTETTYRLIRLDNGTSWRITKSLTKDNAVILRHLRGMNSSSVVDPTAIDQLLRGKLGIPIVTCDPVVTYSTVILLDLDRTCDLLVAQVRDVQARCENGVAGFRPGSPLLRRQFQQVQVATEECCQAMAYAWKASGMQGTVPEWLGAAFEDASGPA